MVAPITELVIKTTLDAMVGDIALLEKSVLQSSSAEGQKYRLLCNVRKALLVDALQFVSEQFFGFLTGEILDNQAHLCKPAP